MSIHRLTGFLFLLCLSVAVFAQQRGEIISGGGNVVLDPDGDGFITNTGNPFSIDGFYVDEFEYNMFGIPFVGDGEVDGDGFDILDCSNTDLAADTTGFSVYSVLVEGNLIFRFRLAGIRPIIKAYSIMIDTDGLIGPDDPNYTPDNPGFEIAITYIRNIIFRGVGLYDIDGASSCPFPIEFYPNSHFQSSVAGTTTCDDEDYFYDFYVPYQDLIDEFGLTPESNLRFVALTSAISFCPLNGFVTDVAGVDDDEFDNLEDIYLQLTEDQCPTTIDDLCETCEGFLAGTTDKPDIDQPVKVGQTSITGTAEPTADIFMDVYDVDSNLLESVTSTADADGFWEISLSQPLNIEDSVIAKAQIEGNCLSGITESDLSFAVAITNQAPTISGTVSTLDYEENGDPISIFEDLSITDVDDTEMDSAWVTATSNYNDSEDVIDLPPDQGLTVTWQPTFNRVRIHGNAAIAVYESIIRGITFSNTSDNPDQSTRSFSVSVHDGLDQSNTLDRDLDITRTNDPPALVADANTIGYMETDASVIIDNTVTINDVDDTFIESATISFTQGYDQVEDTLKFTDQNGIVGDFDDLTGELSLSGSAPLSDYQEAIRSIEYENLEAGADLVEVIDDPTTRIISIQINDGDDESNTITISIDIDISPNVAPVFVDNLIDQNPVDTVVISLLEDTPLDTCLVAIDPDGDEVDIQVGSGLEFGEGVVELDPDEGLCFSFTPTENFDGSEYISFTGCDDVASGSLCDDVVVQINIVPINDLPDIVDDSDNPIDTVFFTALEDTPDNFCIDAVDIESNTLEFSSATSLTGFSSPTIPDPADFCFDYLSTLNFSGFDTLQLVVCEQGSATQCDTIVGIVEVQSVNDPPEITDEGVPLDTIYFDVLEDVITQLCVSAEDPDLDDLEVIEADLSEGPGSFEPLPLGDLCFFFQSSKDSVGLVYGEIIVCDDALPALCDTVIVAVNIQPVNDPPIIVDEDDSPLFAEFDTLYFTLNEDEPFDFCIEARDPDEDPIELVKVVSIDSNGTYLISDPTNLCATLTPDPDYFGRERALLTVCETTGTDPKCDSIAAVFDILPVNDPPQITFGGDPVDTLFFDATEDILTELCINADDPEVDDIDLIGVILNDGPGSFDHLPLGDLCFFFLSDPDAVDVVYGELIVCDNATPQLCDTIVVAINIIPVNDPPVIIDEEENPLFEESDTLYFTVNEDEALEFCIDATDIDGDLLVLSDAISNDGNGDFVITDAEGLCVAFIPDDNFIGSDQGVITVCESAGTDPQCASIVVIIDVMPINDPPVLVDSNGDPIDSVFFEVDEDNTATFCIDGIDIDPDDVLAISDIELGSGGGMFEADGTELCFDFTPNPNFNGPVGAEIIVCDNGDPTACDTLDVIVDVIPINDPPVFVSPEIQNDTLRIVTNEDVEVEFCLDVIDPDGTIPDDPSVSSSTNLGQYSYTQGIQYCIIFTPLSQANGTEYAMLTVCDPEGLCTELPVEIIIEPVNDPPVGLEDSFENNIYFDFSGDVTVNDSDPEGTRLLVSLADGSLLNGNLNLASSGQFTYSPSRSFVGTEEFTYELCDSGNPAACTIVTVTFILNDPLVVWQALSPNGDNMNDTWVIEGIELFPNNHVKVFDRYNNLVFETRGYNNQDKVWFGQSNRGLFNNAAPDGTYFYWIDLGDEKMGKPLSGFLILKED